MGDEMVGYKGEILDGKKATGNGEYKTNYGYKYSGHFVNASLEGAGVKISPHGITIEGEFKDNKLHGKCTLHYKDGRMSNHENENGIEKSQTDITDKEEAFYIRGIPYRVLDFIN